MKVHRRALIPPACTGEGLVFISVTGGHGWLSTILPLPLATGGSSLILRTFFCMWKWPGNINVLTCITATRFGSCCPSLDFLPNPHVCPHCEKKKKKEKKLGRKKKLGGKKKEKKRKKGPNSCPIPPWKVSKLPQERWMGVHTGNHILYYHMDNTHYTGLVLHVTTASFILSLYMQ